MKSKNLLALSVLVPGLMISGIITAAGGAGGAEGKAELEKALTLKPDVENGMDIYEVCAGCHLLEGWGTADGNYPQLAGQLAGVTIKQMADIRGGNRDNPTMYPFTLDRAIGGGPQGLADVAGYIATLKMIPENGVGKGEPGSEEYKHGEKLYKENCTDCHGAKGEGHKEKNYPRIAGQHYKYMVRQFEMIRDGKRRNANEDMVKQIKGFSEKDMQAVINYTSRLPVPAKDKAPSMDYKNPDYD
ncbi:MAG TPA: c-type cytochrome [Chromatiales bacterium]|nr:c-type cytochrome [Thiotrichales bacterium]HIP67063.1 c-type cytochrome [Chromatiales bacterium]